MDKYWETSAEFAGAAQPVDGSRIERVVPAVGDPEAEYYHRSSQRAGMPPRYWQLSAGRSTVAHRHPMRGWLTVTAVVLLALFFIKPLAVLAAIGLAFLIGVVVVGALAVGAVVLAFRLALGGLAPTTRAGWRADRLSLWYQLMRSITRRR